MMNWKDVEVSIAFLTVLFLHLTGLNKNKKQLL